MTIVELPQVGESITEGIIGKWLKKIGDSVEEYEPLVEVVTDKVTMEFPAPESGVLTKIFADEGSVVPMGTPIAEITSVSGDSDVDIDLPEKASFVKPLGNPTTPDAKEMATPVSDDSEIKKRTGTFLKDVRPPGPTGSLNLEAVDVEETPESKVSAKKTSVASTSLNSFASDLRHRYSPVVRKLANENGIDLSLVKGTGIAGRVTKSNLLEVIDKINSATVTASDAGDKHGETIRASLSPIRRMVASNMTKSANTIPHAWTMMSADLSNIVKARNHLKHEFHKNTGSPLTFLAFVLKAVSSLLKVHKEFNASLAENQIIYHHDINIGIAVATSNGLVVPVIHGADNLSVTDLAKAIHLLSSKAKDQSLVLEDVTGGTFTVNNTGALGSETSFSIINYPQAAILNTEAVINKVVAKEDSILIRPMMNICLSFDHRIVDGLQASLFLRDIVQSLQQYDAGTLIS